MEEPEGDSYLQSILRQLPPAGRKKAEELIKSGRKLIAIGYWAGKENTTLPLPENFQDEEWNAAERQMVIDYLRRASPVIGYMGLSWCRFKCGEINMGACDLSDGVYCWPEGLAHYLEKHTVRLPEKFVEHARKNQHASPLPKWDSNAELLALVALDFDWWKSLRGWKRQ